MSKQTHKTEGENRTKIMRFYPFVFTGNDPRKGWRIPLNEIKYNEQRDDEKGRSGRPFASERADEARSGIPFFSDLSYTYFGARYMDHELMTMWLSVDPIADKYPSISPYNYCLWNPVKLIDPDGRDTIKINLNKGSFEQTRADGNHSVQFYKDGKLAYSDEIEKDNCSFLVSKPKKLPYIENGEEKDATTNHLYCTNSGTGELIFKKIAELGSPVEWDYYSRKTGNLDLSMGDLSSSGLKDKMIHGLGQYTKRNVNYWDHYHPNNHSESFFPSYSDQRHARELGGVRCTMFNNGRSMDFNNYVPSEEGGYINVHEFRMLWDRFAI